MEVREIQNKPLAQALSLELDRGQSEAITLAIDLGVEMIVMDERIISDELYQRILKQAGESK